MGYSYKRKQRILEALLKLERRPVGVGYLSLEEDFNECRAQKVLYKMPYCVMVKSASLGHAIKVTGNNFGCKASARALGFEQPKESFLKGEDGYRFGIYKNLDVAKKSSNRIMLSDRKSYGMIIAPLGEFEEKPDVVIIIAYPFQAMRIVQANAYSYGNENDFRLGGLQAMCSETTAFPFMTENLNISMLCAGTRNLCKWKEEELAIGIPYSKFDGILEGLFQTINPLERDKNKVRIQRKLEEINENSVEIVYGKNYDDNLYEFGRSGRR